MKKFYYIILIFLSTKVWAQNLTDAYEYYKKEQFEASIATLNKVQDDPAQLPSKYYLLGLNYYRIANYDLAEKYLSEVTRMNNIPEISMAYYYLGLSQFYKEDYEKSMNSFELSIDTSTDPEHDKKVEKLIEKSIESQNQLELSRKKSTLGLSLGYSYDSNALNVADTDSAYQGHILNTSAYYAYRIPQDKDASIEPTVYFADSRTFDKKLQATEDIQAADTTLILGTLPYKTVVEGYRSTTSLNVGLYMLPSDTQNREISIALIYLKQNLGSRLDDSWDLDGQLIIGRDQSQLNFTNAEDNQNAIKYDLSGALKYKFGRSKNLTAELGAILNEAEGSNASYNKLYSNISYEQPTWGTTYSLLKLSYGTTDYSLSELGRKDDYVAINYSITKDLTERTTLNGFLGLSKNDSTIDDYTYDDVSAGVQYVYLTRF